VGRRNPCKQDIEVVAAASAVTIALSMLALRSLAEDKEVAGLTATSFYLSICADG
jgi:1-aminocyclopropane-1-carboxylate deaminase/D-cysteine desulfhydrase-like pyridoxal-dependent ACC family enzyme